MTGAGYTKAKSDWRSGLRLNAALVLEEILDKAKCGRLMARVPRHAVGHVGNKLKACPDVVLDALVEVFSVPAGRAHISVADIQQDGDIGLVCILNGIHSADSASLEYALQAVVAPCSAQASKVCDRCTGDGALEGPVGPHGGCCRRKSAV